MTDLKLSLTAARINRHLTQANTVKKLHDQGYEITRQRLGYYEEHSGQTPIGLARKLSDIYKVPFDVLFFGE